MPSTIPIVIPYFRNPAALARTKQCISRQQHVVTETFVWDNSEHNIYFTKAVNQGLRKYAFEAASDYILVLNQDAYMHPDCLARMVACLHRNPKIGICAAMSLDKDGNVTFAGGGDSFPNATHLCFKMGETPTRPYLTYWVNGACMLLRTAMIREIGLLDENMLFTHSDIDYSFTARARGWKLAVHPMALVEHSLTSSAKPIAHLQAIKLRDTLYFGKKWASSELYRELNLKTAQLAPEQIQVILQRITQQLRAIESAGDPPVQRVTKADLSDSGNSASFSHSVST